jgi:pyruvate/2-oxoglutarate dehydrogenase complex dihydrolipoamide dehydrogenase (E3) component
MTASQERHFQADMAVHGAGWVPEIDDLALETAGVAREPRGVTVNAYLQSVSNPAVYAAGDAAASGPPLTPTATHEGEVVTDNLLHGNHRRPNYAGLASVAFTVPALATVGLTEEAARTQGLRFQTHYQDTSQWFTTRRAGETVSGYKVSVEEASQRILGAHLLGPHAEEVINIFAVAVRLASVPTNSNRCCLRIPPVPLMWCTCSEPASRDSGPADGNRHRILARRLRRLTSIEEESTTWLMIPCACKKRCSQKPSRPAS